MSYICIQYVILTVGVWVYLWVLCPGSGPLVLAQRLKRLPAMRETWVQSLGRKSPGGGHDNPLQYSCLDNPMDRGAWWATVLGVAKSRMWLKWLSLYARPVLYPFFNSDSQLTHHWERAGQCLESWNLVAPLLWRARCYVLWNRRYFLQRARFGIR